MASARTVVESAEAQKTIDEAIEGNPRLQGLLDGLIWRISRNPEVGYPVPGTHPQLHVIRSHDWIGFDGVIVVAYNFDDDQTVIMGLRVEPPGTAMGIPE